MRINNARGSHSSPGVYIKEADVNYSVKSLGVTSLGLAGETLKGPAFETIDIEKWSEYVDYFGGTSTEKFKGNGYPKYELPYIAKEYLKESKSLKVVRILGLSGYDAGSAWVVKVSVSEGVSTKTYGAVTLRSKGTFNDAGEKGCEPIGTGDKLQFFVKTIDIEQYVHYNYAGDCTTSSASAVTETLNINKENLGRFILVVNKGTDTEERIPVSLNYGERDYILDVLGNNPQKGAYSVFVENFYDYALKELVKENPDKTIKIVGGTVNPETFNLYNEKFQCAQTPWFVSQVQGDGNELKVKRLFKAYTISDGKSANTQCKISIQNIKPDEGTFDFVVRAFNDSDNSPVYLEKFSKCDLIPGSGNYLPLRVGTVDGMYELKSKYVALEMNEEEDIDGLVPCGFMGYPLHKFNSCINMPIAYNTVYDPTVKAKRQYFGFSDRHGVDEDILAYKGVHVTYDKDGKPTYYTIDSNGFHLDSILSDKYTLANGDKKVKVDDEEYLFTAVSPIGNTRDNKIPRIISETYMKGTIYEDVNLRKFTVYPYGGFDGWDIYREQRTNTDDFKASKYGGETYIPANIEGWMNLPVDAINSDYYAYLAGYRQFANPEAVDINIFCTPGIDIDNNTLLVEDALDMIEDTDDGRRGDAIYIITSPNKPSGYSDNEDSMYTADEIVDLVENSNIDSSYAATYWPWVKVFDTEDNKYIQLPVTKDVVRNMAYTDNISYPWFSPAGILRGDVKCVKASKNLKLAEEDALYEGMINPVKTFAVDGVKVWGNKTLYRVDSPLNRINVRRLMLRVKKLVSAVGKKLIFEQYDTSLKNQFLSLVTPILSDIKTNRGISDYRISVDDSPEARDAHSLPASIGIKPTPTMEYLDLTFTIYPESVDFDE